MTAKLFVQIVNERFDGVTVITNTACDPEDFLATLREYRSMFSDGYDDFGNRVSVNVKGLKGLKPGVFINEP